MSPRAFYRNGDNSIVRLQKEDNDVQVRKKKSYEQAVNQQSQDKWAQTPYGRRQFTGNTKSLPKETKIDM